MKLQGSRSFVKTYEDYCDISKEDLEKQLLYLESMFVDQFNNSEIIEAFNKLGYPNPIFKEELEHALCRNNL